MQVLVRWFVCTRFSYSRDWSRRPIPDTFSVKNFSNCHMTNGYEIDGSSVPELQERETITFCFQRIHQMDSNEPHWEKSRMITAKHMMYSLQQSLWATHYRKASLRPFTFYLKHNPRKTNKTCKCDGKFK